MLTPREKVMVATAKAEGVLCALYGIVRDMDICNMVDKNENGKLGDVVADTLAGLEYVRASWSLGGNLGRDLGGDDDETDEG